MTRRGYLELEAAPSGVTLRASGYEAVWLGSKRDGNYGAAFEMAKASKPLFSAAYIELDLRLRVRFGSRNTSLRYNHGPTESLVKRTTGVAKRNAKGRITSDCDRGLIGAAKTIKKTIDPGLNHHPIKSRKVNINTYYDPMFYLSHVCARIRADLRRMRRKTWATSKKIENLEAHLWIYLAWNNGYAL